MSLITSIVTAVAEEHSTVSPFIVGGIAFAVFLTLGIATWSYRDVANRHSDRTGGDSHDTHAGH